MGKDGCESSVFNWSESSRTRNDWGTVGRPDSHSFMRIWEGKQVGRQKDNDLGHFCFPFGLC